MEASRNGPITCREGKELAKLIAALYRRALLDLGRSPDVHIYELHDQDFYLSKTDSKSYRMLQCIAAFYRSLPAPEGVIFINDCLENGRHYRYWYLDAFNPKGYLNCKRNLYRKMQEAF